MFSFRPPENGVKFLREFTRRHDPIRIREYRRNAREYEKVLSFFPRHPPGLPSSYEAALYSRRERHRAPLFVREKRNPGGAVARGHVNCIPRLLAE